MEAAEILFENNPLSVVCSLVCNHENQCEGHCVRGIKGEPVHFSSIENYISDSCFERLDLSCAPSNGMKVGVVGAGPAGITIAIILARRGHPAGGARRRCDDHRNDSGSGRASPGVGGCPAAGGGGAGRCVTTGRPGGTRGGHGVIWGLTPGGGRARVESRNRMRFRPAGGGKEDFFQPPSCVKNRSSAGPHGLGFFESRQAPRRTQ